MLEDVILISKAAMEEFNPEEAGEEIAKKIKLHMDNKWEPCWHVFLGK